MKNIIDCLNKVNNIEDDFSQYIESISMSPDYIYDNENRPYIKITLTSSGEYGNLFTQLVRKIIKLDYLYELDKVDSEKLIVGFYIDAF